jgi:hypothetical protein
MDSMYLGYLPWSIKLASLKHLKEINRWELLPSIDKSKEKLAYSNDEHNLINEF